MPFLRKQYSNVCDENSKWIPRPHRITWGSGPDMWLFPSVELVSKVKNWHKGLSKRPASTGTRIFLWQNAQNKCRWAIFSAPQHIKRSSNEQQQRLFGICHLFIYFHRAFNETEIRCSPQGMSDCCSGETARHYAITSAQSSLSLLLSSVGLRSTASQFDSDHPQVSNTAGRHTQKNIILWADGWVVYSIK